MVMYLHLSRDPFGQTPIDLHREKYENFMAAADVVDIDIFRQKQVVKLYTAVKKFGINETVLALYNDENQLSQVTNVQLPTVSEYINGARVSEYDTQLVLSSLESIIGKTVVGTEGYALTDQAKDIGYSLINDLIKPLDAFAVWLETFFNNAESTANEIQEYCDKIKGMRSLSGSVRMVELPQLKQMLANNDCEKYRKAANDILVDICNDKVSLENLKNEAITMDKYNTATNNVYNKFSGIIEAHSTETDLSKINKDTLLSLGKAALAKLEKMKEIQNNYPGFWKVGFNRGKLHAFIDKIGPSLLGPLGGIITYAVSLAFHHGLVNTVTRAWRILSMSHEADMLVCNEIRLILKAAVAGITLPTEEE